MIPKTYILGKDDFVIDWSYLNMRKISGPQLKEHTLTLEEIFGILDEDWLYDLLPGNGEDDYILGKLKEAFLMKSFEGKQPRSAVTGEQ